ncbi:MAG: esterase [Streptosporangiaceae bacterium]|jgi:S-formylglutathione hydrolase FrmB|nr:esterase [Streptosporangiaceae bacterium]
MARLHQFRPLSAIVALGALGVSLAITDSAHAQGARRAADDRARITSQKALGAREFDITIQSPALGTSAHARVLVPKGWTAGAKRTWPVLYAYHGGHDNYTSWTRSSDIAGLAAHYNVIVVMPDGANGSYTDWYNYGKGGVPKWETFHTVEVRQLMERNYHAGGVRAAIGNSSGGQGAITYAARHPGMFKYAASLSGILSMRTPGIPPLLMLTNAGNEQDPFAIWGTPGVDEANWIAHDPLALAPKLRGTGIFFSSGTTGRPGPGDPNVAPWDIGLLSEAATGRTNMDFRDRLNQLKIRYTADLYGDGRHNWPAWIRETHKIWPTLMKAIGAAKV